MTQRRGKQSVELRAGLRNLGVVARHPKWVLAWCSGRKYLWRQMVLDSLQDVREALVPENDSAILARQPCSALGKLGATQEYLYFLVRLHRPEVVVETGVFRGISSSFILQAMRENCKGTLYSIDLPSASYLIPGTFEVDSSQLREGEEVGFAVPDFLRSRWQLILGDSRLELPRLLDRLGTIHMFYHDSEHTYSHMTWEFETALAHLGPGGVLTSDDVGWNSAFERVVGTTGRFSSSGRVAGRLGVAMLDHGSGVVAHRARDSGKK